MNFFVVNHTHQSVEVAKQHKSYNHHFAKFEIHGYVQVECFPIFKYYRSVIQFIFSNQTYLFNVK